MSDSDRTLVVAPPGNVPNLYATAFSVMHFSNDFAIVMARSELSFISGGTEPQNGLLAIKSTPIACVQMSPQTAKDLFVALKEQIEIYENTWGKIRTDYTSKRDKAAK